jgi:gamma-glutamylcyclotransferase (GGCT)/AIG2-like uncharacterized protein YtfP
MASIKLFTYGTLMSGQQRQQFLSDSSNNLFPRKQATLNGYKMYEYKPGMYPCIVDSSPDDVVLGEIVKVTNTVILTLDQIEQVAHKVFERRDVVTSEGPAIAYVAGDAMKRHMESHKHNFLVIPSGDWRKYNAY